MSEEEISNSMNQDLNLPTDLELSQCMLYSTPMQARERVNEVSKECENVKKEEEGSYFDCCICLELSKEPVVTNCGHLYCWSCLYQWLKVSNAKECPVCKGEISIETLTPIYGGGGGNNKRVLDSKMIPSRPQAKRTESLRNSLDREVRRMRYLQGTLERDFERVLNVISEINSMVTVPTFERRDENGLRISDVVDIVEFPPLRR